MQSSLHGNSSGGTARTAAFARGFMGVTSLGLVVLMAGGCALTRAMDPTTDDLADQRISTPSADAFLAAEGESSSLSRGYETANVALAHREVRHLPLWFDEKRETVGVTDGYCATDADTVFYAFYAPCRFAVNLVALPLSAIDAPPWEVMVSDGEPSQRTFGLTYDATYQSPPPWAPGGAWGCSGCTGCK
jgi:hypothetical protein